MVWVKDTRKSNKQTTKTCSCFATVFEKIKVAYNDGKAIIVSNHERE